jgi:esterase
MMLHFHDLGPSGRTTAGSAATPVVILHGLFGSGDNWLTFARTIAESRRVVLPDLPNHGDSPHTDSVSYPQMSQLIFSFLKENGLAPCVLTGHSMGGKIAMAVALEHAEAVERLCLVDIAPVSDPARHSEILAAMTEVADAGVRSRREAEEIMKKRVSSERERLFLQKSLTEGDDGIYRWKLNLPVIRENYETMLEWPYRAADGYSYKGPTWFISGSRSKYVRPEHESVIRPLFPHAKLLAVPDAGHWVHAEQPEAFSAAYERFLSEQT